MSQDRSLHVVLPAGLPVEDGHGLVQAALDLAPQGTVEVLQVDVAASPAAVAQQLATALAAPGRRLVLLPTGTDGEETAALLADRLQGRSLGRCAGVALEGGAVAARRAVFGGRAQVLLHGDADLTCATLRSTPAAAVSQPDRVHRKVLAIAQPGLLPAQPLPDTGSLPRLDGARVVIAGGRGIGGPEGFELLAGIARALGGGFAGSLPTVDAGWVPVAHQVGISGRFVSPRVYLAVGISGTPQHLAGLAPQTRIFAINKDREAPIFTHCDIGVHGDWHELLPLLAQALESGPG